MVVALGFFHSLMFPTIFALSLESLGRHTKFGASLLVMSIVGGAIIPAVMGWISDRVVDSDGVLAAAVLLRVRAVLRRRADIGRRRRGTRHDAPVRARARSGRRPAAHRRVRAASRAGVAGDRSEPSRVGHRAARDLSHGQPALHGAGGSPAFSFEAKGAADAANPKVQEWERLMWTYQRALPWAKPGEKWVLMDRIYAWPAPETGAPL